MSMSISWGASALVAIAWLIFGHASVSGCVLPSSSTDAGPPGDAALGPTTTGTGCGADPTTGVILCLGTTQCPDVSVNQDVYPECGFYIRGSVTYLACLCSNSLCPIGEPMTCAQAASMLASSNEGTVCGELSDGQCTALATSAADASPEPGSDTGSTCTPSCESMCAGEPDCLQLCGC
jgi:hypothetical protein